MVDGDGGVGADIFGRSRAAIVEAGAGAAATAVRGTGDGLLDED